MLLSSPSVNAEYMEYIEPEMLPKSHSSSGGHVG